MKVKIHTRVMSKEGVGMIYSRKLTMNFKNEDELNLTVAQMRKQAIKITGRPFKDILTDIDVISMKRALIVKKEWLDKIFDEGKIWEMRSAKTNIEERVGLIESGTGLIVGEVDIVGCKEIDVTDESLIKFHKVEDLSLLEKWNWAWILNDAKRYKNPKPYNHPQGAVVWVNFDNVEE